MVIDGLNSEKAPGAATQPTFVSKTFDDLKDVLTNLRVMIDDLTKSIEENNSNDKDQDEKLPPVKVNPNKSDIDKNPANGYLFMSAQNSEAVKELLKALTGIDKNITKSIKIVDDKKKKAVKMSPEMQKVADDAKKAASNEKNEKKAKKPRENVDYVGKMKNFVGGLVKAIQDPIGMLTNALSKFANFLLNKFIGFISAPFKALGDKISKVANGIIGFFSKGFVKILTMPFKALGSLITGAFAKKVAAKMMAPKLPGPAKAAKGVSLAPAAGVLVLASNVKNAPLYVAQYQALVNFIAKMKPLNIAKMKMAQAGIMGFILKTNAELKRDEKEILEATLRMNRVKKFVKDFASIPKTFAILTVVSKFLPKNDLFIYRTAHLIRTINERFKAKGMEITMPVLNTMRDSVTLIKSFSTIVKTMAIMNVFSKLLPGNTKFVSKAVNVILAINEKFSSKEMKINKTTLSNIDDAATMIKSMAKIALYMPIIKILSILTPSEKAIDKIMTSIKHVNDGASKLKVNKTAVNNMQNAAKLIKALAVAALCASTMVVTAVLGTVGLAFAETFIVELEDTIKLLSDIEVDRRLGNKMGTILTAIGNLQYTMVYSAKMLIYAVPAILGTLLGRLYVKALGPLIDDLNNIKIADEKVALKISNIVGELNIVALKTSLFILTMPLAIAGAILGTVFAAILVPMFAALSYVSKAAKNMNLLIVNDTVDNFYDTASKMADFVAVGILGVVGAVIGLVFATLMIPMLGALALDTKLAQLADPGKINDKLVDFYDTGLWMRSFAVIGLPAIGGALLGLSLSVILVPLLITLALAGVFAKIVAMDSIIKVTSKLSDLGLNLSVFTVYAKQATQGAAAALAISAILLPAFILFALVGVLAIILSKGLIEAIGTAIQQLKKNVFQRLDAELIRTLGVATVAATMMIALGGLLAIAFFLFTVAAFFAIPAAVGVFALAAFLLAFKLIGSIAKQAIVSMLIVLVAAGVLALAGLAMAYSMKKFAEAGNIIIKNWKQILLAIGSFAVLLLAMAVAGYAAVFALPGLALIAGAAASMMVVAVSMEKAFKSLANIGNMDTTMVFDKENGGLAKIKMLMKAIKELKGDAKDANSVAKDLKPAAQNLLKTAKPLSEAVSAMAAIDSASLKKVSEMFNSSNGDLYIFFDSLGSLASPLKDASKAAKTIVKNIDDLKAECNGLISILDSFKNVPAPDTEQIGSIASAFESITSVFVSAKSITKAMPSTKKLDEAQLGLSKITDMLNAVKVDSSIAEDVSRLTEGINALAGIDKKSLKAISKIEVEESTIAGVSNAVRLVNNMANVDSGVAAGVSTLKTAIDDLSTADFAGLNMSMKNLTKSFSSTDRAAKSIDKLAKSVRGLNKELQQLNGNSNAVKSMNELNASSEKNVSAPSQATINDPKGNGIAAATEKSAAKTEELLTNIKDTLKKFADNYNEKNPSKKSWFKFW